MTAVMVEANTNKKDDMYFFKDLINRLEKLGYTKQDGSTTYDENKRGYVFLTIYLDEQGNKYKIWGNGSHKQMHEMFSTGVKPIPVKWLISLFNDIMTKPIASNILSILSKVALYAWMDKRDE